jgi:hypothetical protein
MRGEMAETIGAEAISRGVCRLLRALGQGTVTEFPLYNGRRADVMALDRGGRFTIVEIKSSPADYRADRKWGEYLDFCDRFYFAVGPDFPRDMLPEGHGLIVGDSYEATVLREALPRPLHPSRRRTLLLRFGLAASRRLRDLEDPGI